MIHILTKKPIIDMLECPSRYIDETFDEPILKIIDGDASNPVFLLLGYDNKEKLYYFTLEDNDTSEDFYCKDNFVIRMFNDILEGKGEYERWVKG
jgi:hypothetical protein